MSKKDKKQSGVLDYIVDLLRRYESGELSDTMKQALDSWTPDTTDMEHYPMDEQKAVKARKISRHVVTHICHNLKWRKRRTMWKNVYQRYAAAAAIVVLIGGGVWMAYLGTSSFLQSGTNMMAEARKAWTTDDTHRITLTLPDGTIVQVNAGSRFEIAEVAFNKQKREVWLTGEAFFEVAKNPEKPFIIHTGNMTTTVRGTSFNVKAYPQLDENVVSVRTGKVEVTTQNEVLAMLTPGKQMKYNVSKNNAEMQDIDIADIAGWTEGKLVLNNAGVKELCLRLQQQFGVTVHIQDNALSDKLISGTFRKGSTIDEVLSTIGEIHNVHYKINNNSVIIKP